MWGLSGTNSTLLHLSLNMLLLRKCWLCVVCLVLVIGSIWRLQNDKQSNEVLRLTFLGLDSLLLSPLLNNQSIC